jgi:hypothetical protein
VSSSRRRVALLLGSFALAVGLASGLKQAFAAQVAYAAGYALPSR